LMALPVVGVLPTVSWCGSCRWPRMNTINLILHGF
jgi:hypothetical protein